VPFVRTLVGLAHLHHECHLYDSMEEKEIVLPIGWGGLTGAIGRLCSALLLAVVQGECQKSHSFVMNEVGFDYSL
jgi:hypothetical protein